MLTELLDGEFDAGLIGRVIGWHRGDTASSQFEDERRFGESEIELGRRDCVGRLRQANRRGEKGEPFYSKKLFLRGCKDGKQVSKRIGSF